MIGVPRCGMSVALLALVCLSGCITPPDVLVKEMVINSEGLESAQKDRRKSEVRLRQLDAHSLEKGGTVNMSEARQLYEAARSEVDGWIDVLIGRLEIQSKVDVSDAEYRRGPARAVDAFLAYRNDEVKGLVTIGVLVAVFDEIMARRADNIAAARAILKNKLNEMRWRSVDAVLADKETGQ